ncbi:MAG: glycosyltransferase family 39 protein [Actinomycetota bacterium]|nr:glycosyltransferase family 39 protein [Actinomycetota bacterium]
MRSGLQHALTRAAGGKVSRRERRLLLAAIVLGVAARVAYVLATRHYALAGDEVEYDSEGWLIAHGHLFYTRLPYGILTAAAWKPPGYPLWVGIWYAIVGHHPLVIRCAQIPFGAVTIFLSWVLARRLFGPRVAVAAAFVVALYPLAFQYEELLYSESLATPLTIAALIAIFTGTPTRRRAVLCGLLLGMSLLVRASDVLLLAGVLVAWGVAAGWRRGIALTALATLVAALVVVPWTVRNEIVLHGFVPIAIDDAALYGTFNAQSAHDPVYPYAWRTDPPSVAGLFSPRHPLSELELHSKLLNVGLSYIGAHPTSVLGAFFWNGLSRLWDIRHRSRSLAEVPFEGRSRLLTNIGLDLYDVLLPLALIGLWRARRRRALVCGVLAIALAAAIVFTSDSGTRYRAILEPLIAVLACAGALGARAPSSPPPEPHDVRAEPEVLA